MSEPNYNESVIRPFLQRKAQELMTTNMILEAHLLVEQSKVKVVEDRLKNSENEFNLKFSNLETEKQELHKTLNQLTQSKNNEVGHQTQLVVQLQNKVEELTKLSSEQANTISINRNSIREQQVIIEDLKIQLNNLNTELQQARSKPLNKKKKKEEEMLDLTDMENSYGNN